jgi:looped-hinge helix DNA binding domain, AbrB family
MADMRTKEIALDRFGRVVIPKQIRDDLGIEAGTLLRVEKGSDQILLTPRRDTAALKVKDGVLVACGEAAGDVAGALRKHREERLKKLKSARKRR